MQPLSNFPQIEFRTTDCARIPSSGSAGGGHQLLCPSLFKNPPAPSRSATSVLISRAPLTPEVRANTANLEFNGGGRNKSGQRSWPLTDANRHRQTQTDPNRHRQSQNDTGRRRHTELDRGRDRETDRHTYLHTYGILYALPAELWTDPLWTTPGALSAGCRAPGPLQGPEAWLQRPWRSQGRQLFEATIYRYNDIHIYKYICRCMYVYICICMYTYTDIYMEPQQYVKQSASGLLFSVLGHCFTCFWDPGRPK